ncbi:hypothetical protein PWJ77_08255 [Bacillus sp. CNPSo 3703]|nr:hypothetical protein [Bacillus altitudinis]MDE0640461.1 hypothetical protein [Bacillus altitudinis]UYO37232.1 hypothetical protein NF868_09680 [Bacillus zhangzhouensis]
MISLLLISSLLAGAAAFL